MPPFCLFRDRLGMLNISDDELSQRLQALLRQDRLALLIQLAEKWSQKQVLPIRAALIEGEALLHLCQMDRAWTRFREVLEYDPENEDALILVIELFLRRGWPTRARKMIPRLRDLNPRSPRIARLESRAAAPPIGPPRNANQVIQRASPSQLVAIAERFLCASAQFKGQQILELALRHDPQNMRARRLIWACQGDFSSMQNWDDLWDDAVAEEAEEDSIIEPTVNMVMEESEVKLDSFPSLFRFDDEEEGESVEDESESTRVMAFSEEFPPDAETEETRGFDGDTQILDIVGQIDFDNDPFETNEENKPIEISVDNDDDVIVFTQFDDSQVRSAPHIVKISDKIEVVHKRPEAATSTANTETENHPHADSKPPVSMKGGSKENKVFNIKYNRYVLSFALILFIIVLGSYTLKYMAKNQIENRVNASLFSADYNELELTANQLEAQVVSGNPPVIVRQAFLGITRAFLWRDYTHSDSDLLIAEEVMNSEAVQNEIPWIPSAIDAIIASGEKDWESVAVILSPQRNEIISYLLAEASLYQGKGNGDWSNPNPRMAILALEVSETIEDIPVWTKDFQSVEYRLLLLEKFWYVLDPEEKDKHLGHLMNYVPKKAGVNEASIGKLSALQFYRYEFLNSINEPENTHQKRRSILRADSVNPLFQLWVGVDYLRKDLYDEADSQFLKCARIYYDCLLGTVSVKISKDKLSEAKEIIELYKQFHPDVSALYQWVQWAEGDVSFDPNHIWLKYWTKGKVPPALSDLKGLDSPVHQYLNDVLVEASQETLKEDATMDAYLLWASLEMKKDSSTKILDTLGQLQSRNVFTARQWGIIYQLYVDLGYSKQAQEQAIDFYFQLEPNGANAERLMQQR